MKYELINVAWELGRCKPGLESQKMAQKEGAEDCQRINSSPTRGKLILSGNQNIN